MLQLTLDDLDHMRIKLLSAIITGYVSGESASVALSAQRELRNLRDLMEHGGESALNPCPREIASCLEANAMRAVEKSLYVKRDTVI